MEDVSRTIVNRYLVSLFTTGFSCIAVGAGFVRSRKQMFSRYHMSFCLNKGILGGGFKYFLFSSRKLRKMNPFGRAYFSDGLVQPPTSIGLTLQGFKDFFKNSFHSRHQWQIAWGWQSRPTKNPDHFNVNLEVVLVGEAITHVQVVYRDCVDIFGTFQMH